MELDTPESHTINGIKNNPIYKVKGKSKVDPVHALKTYRGLEV
jgi:hypothetical protein